MNNDKLVEAMAEPPCASCCGPMPDGCQHRRQQHRQTYAVVNGERIRGSRYITCKDCGSVTIQSWPGAFYSENVPRVQVVERDDA